MDKSKELTTTHDIVKHFLTEYSDARNSDSVLSFMVYKYICRQKEIDFDTMTVGEFFLNISDNIFPSTETIRRSRQKIQQDNPHLRADEKTEYYRQMNEEIFKKYARGIYE